MISVTVLPRVMPRAAHELFLTGETFDAQRAVAIGLLNAAVPAAELDAEVARYTGMLAKGGPEALALTKQMLRRAPAPTMAEDFAAMLEISAARFASDEGQEGVRREASAVLGVPRGITRHAVPSAWVLLNRRPAPLSGAARTARPLPPRESRAPRGR